MWGVGITCARGAHDTSGLGRLRVVDVDGSAQFTRLHPTPEGLLLHHPHAGHEHEEAILR